MVKREVMPIFPKETPKPWIHKQAFENTANPFYHTPAWRKVRKAYITRHPLCAECERNGVIKQGKVVDHITPIRLGGAQFNWSNLQTLCEKCHNAKSGREAHQTIRPDETR